MSTKPISARTVFLTAWCFFAIATGIGLLLRIHVLWPIPGLNYAFVLHAHSHTAFLGWIYNGFFALALQFFVRPLERPRFARLFLVTQIATVGMLVTFPLQGYARESIAFSSLHVACSGVFAWRLLRSSQAVAAARIALAWAFAFMFLSAVGPIALGPMAAAGLRGTPWYSMAIYFYLHFQYNGWFVFFLLAVLWRWRQQDADASIQAGAAAKRAIHWLAAGCILTLALSTLWMEPPAWVYAVGVVGAVSQGVGCIYLGRAGRESERRCVEPLARGLVRVVAMAFLFKIGLQFLAGWPALAALATQRMVVVGFLHLVFLAVVTPALLAFAVELGWMRLRRAGLVGLALLSAGSIATEAILFLPPAAGLFAWIPLMPRVHESLAVAGSMILVGIGLLLTSFRALPAAGPAGAAHGGP